MDYKSKYILFILAIIIIIAAVLVHKKQDSRETQKSGDSILQILDLDIDSKKEKGETKKEDEIVIESDGEAIVIEGEDKIIVGE